MTRGPDPHPLSLALTSVRFPVTICVLAYGANALLAERFLGSLFHNTDYRLFRLRAGLNEAEPATHRLVRDYADRFGNITIYSETRNVFKSPLMRRMFREPALSTEWTIWCDDDTHFFRPDWPQRLGFRIERTPEVVMWGRPSILWRTDDFILDWIRAAPWYRNLPLRRGCDLAGKEGFEFQFATGGFWAIRTEVLRTLDWPDARLVQANDDFLLGEALRQNGFKMGRFDYGVKINDAPRRNPHAPEVLDLPV
jgi:GT2 family glycosyltransferase